MIRVEVDYSPRLTRGEQQILQLPNRLRNLKLVMQGPVASAANAMLRRHWDSKGAAFGHRWAPLADSTIKKRLAKGTLFKGILRDTDHLFRTLFRARKNDGRLTATRGRINLQLNVGVSYAVYHQVGTQFMPDRQVIPDPLPESFKKTFRGIVREFILSGRITNDQ